MSNLILDARDDAGDSRNRLLLQWLRSEEELRGHVNVVHSPIGNGALGSGVEHVLVSAVGAGGAITILAASLNAWLKQPRGAKVYIRIEGANGNKATLTADRVKEIEPLLRQVMDIAE